MSIGEFATEKRILHDLPIAEAKPGAKVLSRLLASSDIRLHAVALCEVREGQSLVFDPFDVAVLHYVLAGSGWLEVEGCQPVSINANAIVIIPPNRKKRVSLDRSATIELSATASAAMTVDGLLRMGEGDGNPGLIMACGFPHVSHRGAESLFDGIKEPLVEDIRALETAKRAFQLMLAETEQMHFGTQALTETLMKQCLILAIRNRILRRDFNSPLFSASRDADPRLMAVIAAVMERPAAAHSVTSLGEVAGMSRSSFAKKFVETFHESPMDFVLKTRLHHAARILASTPMPIKLVSSGVGFSSRSHFSRAFHATYGVSPSDYRQSRFLPD